MNGYQAENVHTKHFRELFPPHECARYMGWRLLGRKFPITVTMKNGARLTMRPQTDRGRDYGTAYDVFIQQVYHLNIVEPRTIVDLGANVGYATLYFAMRYAKARIYAFEPHPEHASCAQRLVNLNGLQQRVTIYGVGAGVCANHRRLSDSGTSSTVLPPSADSGLEIKIIDFFDWVRQIGAIDLLKMDIEGAEFPILSDSRFAALPCRDLIMECHNDADHPDAVSWCVRRLESAGFEPQVRSTDAAQGMGIIYAHKDPVCSGERH